MASPTRPLSYLYTVLQKSTAIFAVRDVEETLRYYKDVLGFTSTWTWGEPPTFGGAQWGDVGIMFCFEPEICAGVAGHQHWLDVEDVNSLYTDHIARGAEIVSPIEDKPWGSREYVVRDINGYHLRIAGKPAFVAKPSGEFPSEVRIERRMPTLEEFAKVAVEAFYRDGVKAEVLERTWRCVVATLPDGSVIGMTRIMYDAPGWFSVWDVAVVPEWQSRRIGAALMKETLAVVREESPGAFVYLFTYKDGFYERLGFSKGTMHSIKV